MWCQQSLLPTTVLVHRGINHSPAESVSRTHALMPGVYFVHWFGLAKSNTGVCCASSEDSETAAYSCICLRSFFGYFLTISSLIYAVLTLFFVIRFMGLLNQFLLQAPKGTWSFPLITEGRRANTPRGKKVTTTMTVFESLRAYFIWHILRESSRGKASPACGQAWKWRNFWWRGMSTEPGDETSLVYSLGRELSPPWAPGSSPNDPQGPSLPFLDSMIQLLRFIYMNFPDRAWQDKEHTLGHPWPLAQETRETIRRQITIFFKKGCTTKYK
jgi:hypothetical protein